MRCTSRSTSSCVAPIASRSAILSSSSDAFTSRAARSFCDSRTFFQSSLIVRGSMPCAGQRPQLIFDVDLDLPVDVGFRHRKIVQVHQLVDQLVLGVFLRRVLALALDRLCEPSPSTSSSVW